MKIKISQDEQRLRVVRHVAALICTKGTSIHLATLRRDLAKHCADKKKLDELIASAMMPFIRNNKIVQCSYEVYYVRY